MLAVFLEGRRAMEKEKLKHLAENLLNDRFALGEIVEGIRNYAKGLENDDDLDGLPKLYGFAQLIDLVEQDLMDIQDSLSGINDLRA